MDHVQDSHIYLLMSRSLHDFSMSVLIPDSTRQELCEVWNKPGNVQSMYMVSQQLVLMGGQLESIDTRDLLTLDIINGHTS